MVWHEIATRRERGPCGFNAAYGAIMAAFMATQKTPVNKNTRDIVSIASPTGCNRIYYAFSSVGNQVLTRSMRHTPHPYRYFWRPDGGMNGYAPYIRGFRFFYLNFLNAFLIRHNRRFNTNSLKRVVNTAITPFITG
jgi:hypothetical protein